MLTAPFNVAVVGYGFSAKVFNIPLILALPNDFKLYGIVQRSPKPDDDASKDHPDTKSWRSIDEVYTDPKVDVVVLTTVPATHFEMTKRSLESGKHVVVEKPFVATAAEAQELINVSRETGKKLAVYQNRRWDSDYLTVRKIISEGLLGDIAEFETHFDHHQPDPPTTRTWTSADQPGHGAIYDLGVHLIDQVYYLFGLPRKVTAVMHNQRRGVIGGSHDAFTALLHYDHTLVTAKASVVSAEVEQLRFWIRGTKGTFKKNHLDIQESHLLTTNLRPPMREFGLEPESHHGTLTTVSAGDDKTPRRVVYPTVAPPTWVEFYRLFARALRGEEKDVPVTGEEARDVLRIVEAAGVSAQEGRTVVL